MVTEVIVGGEFDCLLGRDEQNVHGRSAVHTEVTFSLVRLFEAVEPTNETGRNIVITIDLETASRKLELFTICDINSPVSLSSLNVNLRESQQAASIFKPMRQQTFERKNSKTKRK